MANKNRNHICIHCLEEFTKDKDIAFVLNKASTIGPAYFLYCNSCIEELKIEKDKIKSYRKPQKKKNNDIKS